LQKYPVAKGIYQKKFEFRNCDGQQTIWFKDTSDGPGNKAIKMKQRTNPIITVSQETKGHVFVYCNTQPKSE